MRAKRSSTLSGASLVLALAAWPAIAGAQSRKVDLDWSGVDAFWRVHAVLASDREPSRALWDSLFATPGYALLQERERRRDALVGAFRLAFRPSLRAQLDSAQARADWVAMVLPHLRDVPGRRDSVEKFRGEIERDALFDQARERAQRFLPVGTTARVPAPRVSILYFKDARGYERILIDPLYLMRVPDRVELIGHELHHYYRNKVAKNTRPYGNDLLAWAIANVETEGVAGLVDKAAIPTMSDAELERRYRVPSSLDYFRSYRREYARSNDWLRFTQGMLERIAAHPDSAAVLGAQLHRELPDNGRAMGAYMATIIIDRLGHDALLAVVGDPFSFWERYNEAARQTGGRALTLSERAMSTIRRVRDSYSPSY
ncbi:MAG TPA: DUF5700 domain-containing putative Zn-dependent protease [Gemmatimonadaceae bacterium]|nr:DUF5700 domain-containing putative Zn-dependent protease [Gemmatimonadaceae bacterium]